LAMSFNVSTLEIASLLSTNEEARDNMVALASAYVKENEGFIEDYKKDKLAVLDASSRTAFKEKLDSLLKANGIPEADAENVTKNLAFASDSSVSAYGTKLDSLLKIKAELEADIEDVNQIMGFRPIENLPLKEMSPGTKLKATQRKLVAKENKKTYVLEFPNTYLADQTEKFYSVKTKEVEGKTIPYAEFNDLKYIVHNFWGYLITALAISLGAPFWFDLLSKLIRIRTSVQNKPRRTTESNTPQDGRIPTNQRVG